VIKLQVYVTDDCWTCEEAYRVVADVRPLFPEVEVELINVNDQMCPAFVFAVPTYLLNGRIIFLGNPTRQELSQTLKHAGSSTAA
jgi:hypothetical protein